MKAKRSIEGKIRRSLLGYTILIVLLLWAFQIVFLNTYYQTMQRMSILKAGKQVAASVGREDFEEQLENICYEHRMCSMVVDEKGKSFYSIDMMGRGCLIHSPSRFSLIQIIEPVLSGEREELVQTVQDEHFHSMGLIYARACTLEEGQRVIIVLNAGLDPVKSTEGILKSQLWIITAVLGLIAIIISRLISQNISRPLQNISRKARRLAKGEYQADYDGGGLAEIDELAETLNFAAEGLSKVEDLRRELVANVSHDLKTPLTMIKAYAEMIRDLTGDDPKKREEQLEVIISEADRLTALVSVLIRISQDEREGRVYHAEPFEIGERIQEVTRRFAQTNPEYSITCELEGPAEVSADRESIGQVLYNLISNAINYTGEDKKVFVSQRRTEAGMIRVEIRDTGRGIPADQLPLIWERYYRSRNTHQRPVVGSGLGLSIVKGALTAQNLPFGVESQVGKGSCFWFELPLATDAPPLPASQPDGNGDTASPSGDAEKQQNKTQD